MKPKLKNKELIVNSQMDKKYYWWAGGLSIAEILAEMDAPDDVIRNYTVVHDMRSLTALITKRDTQGRLA